MGLQVGSCQLDPRWTWEEGVIEKMPPEDWPVTQVCGDCRSLCSVLPKQTVLRVEKGEWGSHGEQASKQCVSMTSTEASAWLPTMTGCDVELRS